MKTATILRLPLLLPFLGMGLAAAQDVDLHWTSPVKERYVTFYAEPQGKAPEEMAVLVGSDAPWVELRKRQLEWEAEARTNRDLVHTKPYPFMTTEGEPDFEKAVWIPFKTNLSVDFGPGDGGRWLWVCFKNKDDDKPRWDASHSVLTWRSLPWKSHLIFVQTSPPSVVLTNPTEWVTSQPMIQLEGYVTTDLGNPLRYQVVDQDGAVTASGEGLVSDRYLNQITSEFTTNFFTCYDLVLNQGTNMIVLSGTDAAGFSFTTNFMMVFTTLGDTKPPVFSIDSPQPGTVHNEDTITIRGPIDDPTARMVGQISADGRTNNLTALIERDGYFWFENLPLAQGANDVMFTATDAAGNSSSTNFVIYGANDHRISMDPVSPADQLWQPSISVVTGHVHPADRSVWINGVQATVKPDGTWLAKNVPVASSPSGSTAIFDMEAVSPDDMAKGNIKVDEQVSAQANLGTNTIVLNASSPVCGVFQLHLAVTTGHSFILQASTNLLDWTPILTNLNSSAIFDYTDTNANNFQCRFFRVIPMQ